MCVCVCVCVLCNVCRYPWCMRSMWNPLRKDTELVPLTGDLIVCRYMCTCIYVCTCMYCCVSGDQGIITYRMRVNFRGTKLSRIADFQIFTVFIFADAGVTNIILLVYTSISILIRIMKLSGFFCC